ncbi:2,3-bisphosphoglycerate-independent phosphoglycerate mutase [Candidatus Berkelbacteria bacterium]|nr:2,3-bisphosphoglycerate-independent phosphoglycerate mutase [Candidatus Berkelbacteria bacterium]
MGTQSITDVKIHPRPIVLLILDGWGLSPSWGGNAIALNDPPTFNYLWKYYPHTVLQAFKVIAGPSGIVGSSEIGHASIGSGRVVQQDLTEISLAIESGVFYKNQVLKDAFATAKEKKKRVHLIGLLSEGGIHGSLKHALALVEFAKREGVKDLWLHPFTDGEDSDTHSAQENLHALQATLGRIGVGRIGTISGRFYGLDRDGYWDRTARVYEALVYGRGEQASTPAQVVSRAYQAGLDDEHIPPTVIQAQSEISASRIQPGDVVIHWNFRADRARQLVRAFLDRKVFRPYFIHRRYPLAGVSVVSFTDYHLDLPNLTIAFPSAVISNTLSELLATHKLTQLHVAESEKYAHVTYFFNGGLEEPHLGEDRIIVPSPRAQAYDTVPAMSAGAITRILERSIRRKSHDFIVANFANVDIVAHTGNLAATGKAVLVVDEALRRIANAVIDVGGALFITADHGNAESVARLKLEQDSRETLHTLNPVPFMYIAREVKKVEQLTHALLGKSLVGQMLTLERTLADVAPTILDVMGIPAPNDMTGASLVKEFD